MRRFLDTFRSKQSKVNDGNAQEETLLIEPQLAYAAGRQPYQVGPLFEMLKPAIDRVHDKNDFDRLTKFLESVVAYHKYHGGEE
jgi:CRISPR-associated protein Csm2